MISKTILAIILSISAGISASSNDEVVSGPGPDQIIKALDFEKAIKGINDEKRKPHGMIMLIGPGSKNEPGFNPFMSLLRQKQNRKYDDMRTHGRHRIHRYPVPINEPNMFMMNDSAPKLTNTLLEIMKVRERIVVDEQNRPKSAELAIINDLMKIDPNSGQIKMLRHGEIRIKPKNHQGTNILEKPEKIDQIVKSVGPERILLATEFGENAPKEGSRLDSFIRKLHLDQFWPLFIFSALCGFTFVGLTFLAAKLIFNLIDDSDKDSYEPIPSSGSLLNSIESAQPIKITSEMIQVNENSSLVEK